MAEITDETESLFKKSTGRMTIDRIPEKGDKKPNNPNRDFRYNLRVASRRSKVASRKTNNC